MHSVTKVTAHALAFNFNLDRQFTKEEVEASSLTEIVEFHVKTHCHKMGYCSHLEYNLR